MERVILLGNFVLVVSSVTSAWDCSDSEEKKFHSWCDHGCCFRKNPVSCCTWAESMGTVFWTFVGLGSGLFVLSLVVGIVCCHRKKKAFQGQIISTNDGQRQAVTTVSEQTGRSSTIIRYPTAQARITNSAARSNRTPRDHQSRQARVLNTANERNRHSRALNLADSRTSNLHPRNVNISNRTSSNVHSRTAVTSNSSSALRPRTVSSNNITTSNLHPRTVNISNRTTSNVHPRTAVTSNTYSDLHPRAAGSNNIITSYLHPRTVSRSNDITSNLHEQSIVETNTNSNSTQQQTSTHADTQSTELPPSYDSLPPSYESIFAKGC